MRTSVRSLTCELNLSSLGQLLHIVGIIRLGTSADLAAAASVDRRASLSNVSDRDNLLAHPEYLILGPEGLAEGRTYVAEEDCSLVGFATWTETNGTVELEDLFVDPGYRGAGSPPRSSAASRRSCGLGALSAWRSPPILTR